MRRSTNPVLASSLYLRLLAARQAELLEELRSKRQDIDESRGSAPVGDPPARSNESSIVQKLSAIESDELRRVNTALEKLRTGTYGDCDRCRDSIPAARLKAIPWAEHCRNCEARSPQEQVEPIRRAL